MGIVFSITSSLFYTVCHMFMQFFLFLVVDFIVKASLTNSRSVCERRRLWQIEGMVLAMLSIIFLILDRFPIILFILAGLSFLSSVPHGQEVVKSFQVYFQDLFNTARRKWKSWYKQDSEVNYSESYPEDTQQRYGEPGSISSTTYTPSSLARPSIRHNRATDSGNQRSQFVEDDKQLKSSVTSSQVSYHSHVTKRRNTPARVAKQLRQTRQSTTPKAAWTSKFISYLGYGSVETLPPGLRNRGQNLCFLNSVMQCMAHLPNVFPSLSREISRASGRCTALESTYLEEFCDLLIGCSSLPTSAVRPTVDTYRFRKAASRLSTHIVAHPDNNNQTQQDAAEFLTWILNSLHDILQKVSSNQVHTRSSLQSAQVEQDLGNMSRESLEALKMKLFRQLESQESMYDDASVTAVRTLSDVEWYQLNQDKRSFVTDNFGGQLIELYENQTLNRVAVSIQLFHILPIPLVEPRQISGIVQLQDCINNLSSIEHGLPESSTSMLSRSLLSGKKTDPSTISLPLLSPPMYTSTPGRDQSPNNSSCEVRYQTIMRFPPMYLILQLNRFTYNSVTGRTRKIKTPVSIPLTDLDLSSTLFEQHFSIQTPGTNPGPRYDLQGMCLHEGGESTESGHYVGYCKASDDCWYRLDDEVVNRVNMAYECCTPSLRRNSYLLFYARKDV